MSDIDVERATIVDLADLGAIGGRSQADPDRYVAYFAATSSAIQAEVAKVAGAERWPLATHVAHRAGRTVGWLLAETDIELGRVWWWGPAVDLGQPWDDVADRLYDASRHELDARIDQEELAVDSRSGPFARFAERHGFRPEEASSIFRAGLGDTVADERVVPLTDHDADRVAALHDSIFPNTHTTGRQLVQAADGERLVARDRSGVVGYIAFEVQADGEGYIDFVGVDPAHRGHGIGEALVTSALDTLRRRGSTAVNLTVRIDTAAAARRLYRRLGFDELRVVRPFRKGFTIP